MAFEKKTDLPEVKTEIIKNVGVDLQKYANIQLQVKKNNCNCNDAFTVDRIRFLVKRKLLTIIHGAVYGISIKYC